MKLGRRRTDGCQSVVISAAIEVAEGMDERRGLHGSGYHKRSSISGAKFNRLKFSTNDIYAITIVYFQNLLILHFIYAMDADLMGLIWFL